ncbi:MAG: hypothetical protein GC201_11890 [Alphaproteobacteria bacterium]|nr:hypothetical protein [Alphaproteobacteria bacterium]
MMFKSLADRPMTDCKRHFHAKTALLALTVGAFLAADAYASDVEDLKYSSNNDVYNCRCAIGSGNSCRCLGRSSDKIPKGKTVKFKARCADGTTQIRDFREAKGSGDKERITCATNRGASDSVKGIRYMKMECTNWSSNTAKYVNLVVQCWKNERN